MSSNTVITSFSPHGYNLYGRNFIETFARFWPKSVRLAVYVETEQEPIEEYNDREVLVLQLADVLAWSNFYDRIKSFRLMCGDTGQGYSIDYDARMARKTFMQNHAVKRFGGRVIWIDADSLTHSVVPDSFIDSVLPSDKFCCYLGRKNIYTESGFLGFNADHPIASPFFEAYVKMFTTGSIFTFERWHDCIAFDAVREQAEKKNPDAFNNLGAGVDPGPGLQVFINSALGKYMDHLKGGRKSRGHSPLSDLTVNRDEPYWQRDTEAMVSTR